MATIDLSQLSSSPILSTDDSFVSRLNITTSGEQQNPVVTGLPNGNFVVVWADRAGNDGSEGGIFAQIYTSQFEAVGSEFIVNSYTDYWQTRPEVSSTSSGDFLVTWAEGNGYLSAQFFNQSGAQIGEQFNMRPGWNHHADIAVSADGGFWVSGNVAQDAIYIKKISSDGIDLIADVKIDRDVFQADPTITILQDQRVLVTWNEESETGSNDIYAQLVSDSGVLLGEAFLINQNTNNNQLGQEVTALTDGGFAITWQSENQDGDGYGIIVRQFDNELIGTDEIIVNEITLGDQTDPTITADSEGGFLVGWTDNIHINGGAVYAQRFDTAANKIGSNIHLNDDGVIDLNNSKDVEIAELQDGSFVAAWDAWSGTRDIYARKIADEEVQPILPEHTFSVKALNGKYLIDGEVAPALQLISGRTYEFDLSDPSLSTHPLRFNEGGNPFNGSLGFDGTLGVDQILTLTVPSMTDGVGLMSYYCTNHSGMGNDIEIKFNNIFGTNTDDVLTGLSGSDWIEGFDGNDTIDGSAGQDYVDGGEGHDTLFGGVDDDTLNGRDGNDTLEGGAGDDVLYGDGSLTTYTFNAILTERDENWTTVGLERVDLALGLYHDSPFSYSFGDKITFFGGEVVRMIIDQGTLYDTINFDGYNDSFEAYDPVISEYSNVSDERYILIEQPVKLNDTNHTLTFEIYSEGDHFDQIQTIDDWFDNSQRKSQGLPEINAYKPGVEVDYNDAVASSLASKSSASLGSGDDTLDGGAGNDTLDGGSGDDTLDGGSGNDTLDGGAGINILNGGEGDDTYQFAHKGIDTITDISGSDTLVVESVGETGDYRFRKLYQDSGDLILEGSRDGEASKVTMSGVENITWQAADDSYSDYTMTLGISGEASSDTNRMYVGTLEDDTLISGSGDYVEGYGAEGDDTITILGGGSWASGDAGHDTLIGGDGNDTLHGDFGSGFAGNDILKGNGGDDNLIGSDGNDTLEGGSGNDLLLGGNDDDTLSGGAGSDTFVFKGEFGQDTITDYNSDEDTLEFYAGDGTELNISDLIETVNSDGNRVLSTADGLSSVTLEGSAGITPVSGGLAMSVVSQDGDVVTFGVFADPITDPDEDGIGSFDFTLNHDALDMQIDAGSLVFATGLSGLQNYDANSGTLTAGAFTLNNVEDLDAPLLTFEATMLDTKAPISIQITDIVVDGDDFASTTEVFDFSALAITTTITDRFGNAITSAEAQAYEDSVNEITATSTTGNVTVFDTASGSDVLINAAMDIDTDSDKAIGAFDALQALRLAVGLTKSDGTAEWHDYLAADINKDGRVGADDALDILKFAVGLTDGAPADWIFVDGDADWSGIDRRNTDYDEGVMLEDVLVDTSINMTGILVGDLDGSYAV
ncbi:hypothetical protein OAE29_04265 [Octadecabacter sp.]|nr:hypothetical protein [Octadecabacter sp.]